MKFCYREISEIGSFQEMRHFWNVKKFQGIGIPYLAYIGNFFNFLREF